MMRSVSRSFCDQGAGLLGGGLEQLDRIDLPRAGLDAKAGEDRILAAADIDHHLVADRAVERLAEALVADVVIGHRAVKRLVEKLLAARARGGGPEFDLVRALGDHVADEPLRAGLVLAGDHGAIAHAGLALEDGLDFRGLDALAADL